MRLVSSNLVVEFVCLIIIRAPLARRLYIGLPMKLKEELSTGLPRVDQAGASFHVVLDLHALAGRELDLPGIDLVPARLRDKRALDQGGAAVRRSFQDRHDSGGNGVLRGRGRGFLRGLRKIGQSQCRTRPERIDPIFRR